MLQFFKYHGTGNDFVLIDNRKLDFTPTKSFVEKICHRRFGVGADGVILIQNIQGCDFQMVYFNSDGNQSTLCGNGARCTVNFAHSLGIFSGKTTFKAVDGDHFASIENGQVCLGMNDVLSYQELQNQHYFLDTGSPHLVIPVASFAELNVKEEGKKHRYKKQWAKQGGVNVNFIKKISESRIEIRTYERGVEDETFSCGTGATAAALVSFLMWGIEGQTEVSVKGGSLKVRFDHQAGKFKNVFLTGPAVKVFSGTIPLEAQ